MAVNRFLNVNWSQPISSFVPRPFEAAYMAGKQEQDQFDAGKQITGEIDTLSGAVKNTPNDEPAKQQMINEYRAAIKNTVDKYQGSFADPNFQYEAKNIINQFKNDKRLSIFATNLRRLDDFEKYAGDKNNKMDVFHNAKQWQEMNDPYNPKVYDPIAVTKYSNPTEQIAKYYDKIEEQGVDKSIVDMNPEQYGEGKWFLDRSGNVKFIKQDQLENIANANLSGYTGTEAGIWDLRRRIAGTNIEKQLAQAGITADQLDGTNYQQILGQLKLGQIDVPERDAKGKPTGKTIKQDYTAADYINDGIKKDMVGYGTQFLHVVEDVDWKRTRAQFDDEQAAKRLEDATLRPVYQTEALSVEGAEDKYDFNTMMFDYRATDAGTPGVGGQGRGSFGGFNPFYKDKYYINSNKQAIIDYKELNDDEKQLADNVIKLLSPEEKALFNKYKDKSVSDIKNSKQYINGVYTVDPKPEKEYSDLLSKIYTMSKVISNKAISDVQSNNIVTGLSNQESKELNTIFGGKLDKDMQVNDLTTGIGSNAYIYDPSTGNATTMSKFIEENSSLFGTSEDEFGKFPVRVSGKVDPKNYLTTLTGNAGFADGLQVVINGKPYYITGPEAYKDQYGNINVEKKDKKAFDQTVNRIWQMQVHPEKIHEENILGTKVNIIFDPNTQEFKMQPVENFKQTVLEGNTKTTYDVDAKSQIFADVDPANIILQYNTYIQKIIADQKSAGKNK